MHAEQILSVLRERSHQVNVMINYINTDLVLVAPHPLDLLIATLETNNVVPIQVMEIENGCWHATFETLEHYSEPEVAISTMLRAIEELVDDAYSLWDGCYKREVSIGYTSGRTPFSFQHELSDTLILRMSRARLSMKIVLYGSAGVKLLRDADAHD